MNSVKNRLVAMMIVIFVIGTLGYLTQRFDTMQWLVENETQLRQLVGRFPWQGWFFGLAIYTVFSMIPGIVGKSVVCGWLFGFWQSVLMVNIGLTVAAIIGFITARFFVREAVNARWGGLVNNLNTSLKKDGPFFLLMMRLAHVPFSVVNYGAGATSVPLRTFCWTTALGVLPGTVIFVFVGTRIPTLAALAEKGVWQLFDPLLFGILTASAIFPVLIRWAISKYRQHRGSPSVTELTELDSMPNWSIKGQTNGTH